MEPIRVKGIQRDVRPYALQNVLAERDEKNRFIRTEDEGIRLFLDLAKMNKRQRTKAAKNLEKAAAKLRGT